MDIKKFYGKLTDFANTPKYVFFLSLTIAALSTILYTLFLTDVYRDTTHVYAPYVRELAQGNWAEGIATQVPMLNITLAGVFAFLGLESLVSIRLTFCPDRVPSSSITDRRCAVPAVKSLVCVCSSNKSS